MDVDALPSRDEVDHAPARAQGWWNVDGDVREWCLRSVLVLDDALGGLTAAYLHGSLATGCFYRPKSDLDLLLVIKVPLDARTRRRFAVAALDSFDARPTVGGLEVSVITADWLGKFTHPLPYEAHFSETWAEEVRHGGCGPTGRDGDLAAHCTVARHVGIVLSGPPPAELLPHVPRRAFRAAVLDDFEWIVQNDHILESPFYGVLNICRTLQLLTDPGVIASKDDGAAWALRELPTDHHQVIRDAAACYRSAAQTPVELRRTHGHTWEPQPLLAFRDYARRFRPKP